MLKPKGTRHVVHSISALFWEFSSWDLLRQSPGISLHLSWVDACWGIHGDLILHLSPQCSEVAPGILGLEVCILHSFWAQLDLFIPVCSCYWWFLYALSVSLSLSLSLYIYIHIVIYLYQWIYHIILIVCSCTPLLPMSDAALHLALVARFVSRRLFLRMLCLP